MVKYIKEYQTLGEAAMYYGPVMIDLEGVSLSPKERVLLQHAAVGGVLLFKRNYTNIAALKSLVAEIREVAINPVLIAVDHEGGIVWRFKEGFTKLPAAKSFGQLYDNNPSDGLSQAKNAGMIMAKELLQCGIDISFAPVLDLDKAISQVILDRAFHSDPNIVTQLAGAFIEGMNEAGMAATGKHFPGHGGCESDSHLEHAIDSRSLNTLQAEDLLPFQNLSSVLKGVMPAHVIYPDIDSVPAGYSKRWLQDILRMELGFKGAIISDCLSMKGAAIGGDFVVRARMALDAGCDMVILCQQERELVAWVLDKLDRETSEYSNQRLSQMAGDFKKKPIPLSSSLSETLKV